MLLLYVVKKASEKNTTHFMHNTLLILGFMVLKTTKKRLCELSHNSKTTGIISVKFYIKGPCILFWGGTAAQHRP
jgi:hypothetical protein